MFARLGATVAYLDLPTSLTLPIWKEARAGRELRAARDLAPPTPAATPQDVLVVGGFLDDGSAVRPLAARLRGAGHRVTVAAIGRNIACTEVMAARLERALDDAVAAAGGPVVLVGHSRGGTLSRVLAVRRPADVAGVVCAGSPLADPHASTIVLKLVKLAMSALSHLGVDGLFRDCGFGACCETFFDDLAAPFPEQVPLVSLLSRSDGIVAAHAPRDPAAEVVELDTTHVGLVSSPDGMAAVESALARVATRSALGA